MAYVEGWNMAYVEGWNMAYVEGWNMAHMDGHWQGVQTYCDYFGNTASASQGQTGKESSFLYDIIRPNLCRPNLCRSNLCIIKPP
jgi:hypothetical protein